MSTAIPIRKRADAPDPDSFLTALMAKMLPGSYLLTQPPATPAPLIDPVTRAEVLPGTIGLTSISGEVGRLIRLGQWLAGNPIRRWLERNTEPNLQHAFVYLGGGQIIEAEPGGAVISSATKYGYVYWCMGIAGKFTEDELAQVAATARDLKGVKYSFLDYAYLAAHRLHIPVPGLKNEIANSRHLICSQLDDEAYAENACHVFADGRWPGYVMPMDLYLADQEALAGK